MDSYQKVFLYVILFLIPLEGMSQDNSPFYEDRRFDNYLNYLLNKGEISIDHPLIQPLTISELREGINGDSINTGLFKLFKQNLDRYYQSPGKYGSYAVGALVNAKLFSDSIDYDIGGSIRPFVSYSFQNFTAHFSLEANTDYRSDTVLFGIGGKLQNENLVRSSSSYLRFDSKYFRVFYGRLSRNYGFMDTQSLIWSDNPLPFDHFLFEFRNKKLKFSMGVSRLNDKLSYDIRDSIDDTFWAKRFLSFHRLDFALGKRWNIALSESVVYGGENQQFLPSFLNPLNFFFVEKFANRRVIEENAANNFGAFEVYYRSYNKLSFYTQFLIDDMDFTRELREEFPDRIGFKTSLVFTDLLPSSMINITYNYLSNWTYNSYYTYGNYTFAGRSLGFEKNGFNGINIGFDYFGFDKMIIDSDLFIEEEREQDLLGHFPGVKTDFPLGVEQRTLSAKIGISYFPINSTEIRLEFGWSYYKDFQHVENLNKSYFLPKFEFIWNGVISKEMQ